MHWLAGHRCPSTEAPSAQSLVEICILSMSIDQPDIVLVNWPQVPFNTSSQYTVVGFHIVETGPCTMMCTMHYNLLVHRMYLM